MLGKIPEGKYVEYAKDIHGSGSHLLTLINQILDVTQVDAGSFRLQEEAIDLSDLIGELVQTVGPESDQKNQTLEISLQDDLPQIQADQAALRRVLMRPVFPRPVGISSKISSAPNSSQASRTLSQKPGGGM